MEVSIRLWFIKTKRMWDHYLIGGNPVGHVTINYVIMVLIVN